MKPINHIQNALAYIDIEIEQLEIQTTKRSAIFGTLSDVSIEHAKSIFTLIEGHLYASALCLVRPMYETGVRSLWINRCASDQQVETFSQEEKLEQLSEKGKVEKLSVGNLVDAIEKVSPTCGALSHLHSEAWGFMNSYVHGGMLQVSKRLTGGNITPEWSDELEHEVCKVISVMLIVVFSEILETAESENKERLVESLEKHLEPVLVPANAS